jgi:hypothetical protein
MDSDFTLYFSKDCSLKSARRLHRMLLDAVERGGPAAIDCSGVSEADVSFVQLLISAQATFRGRGLAFRIVAAGDVLCAALARAGYHLDPAVGRIS